MRSALSDEQRQCSLGSNLGSPFYEVSPPAAAAMQMKLPCCLLWSGSFLKVDALTGLRDCKLTSFAAH